MSDLPRPTPRTSALAAKYIASPHTAIEANEIWVLAETLESESDARAERIAVLEARLELLHDSLGSLAPAGTWLCDEVLRPIWQAKHRDVAITVAKIAQPLIAANGLWVGDREMASEHAKLREAVDRLIIGACAVAVPHAGERAVLQEAFDFARQALAGKDMSEPTA